MYCTRPLLLALLAAGCGREQDKRTSVSMPDPSPLTVVLAPGDGLDTRSLNISGGHLVLQGCARGTGASLFLGEDTELAGMETTLLGGNWCGLTLTLNDTATLRAITHSGRWLQAPIGDTEIVLGSEDGVSVSGQAFILELGAPGWVTADALGTAETGDRTLEEGDPELKHLRDALRRGSALYQDLDGNGVLGTDERSAVRATHEPDSTEDTGTADTGAPDTGGQDSGGPDAVD